MLQITREKVEALKEDLAGSRDVSRCREELVRILEIKEALLWRAEAGACCAGSTLPGLLFGQVQLLESILQALEEGEDRKAASLLEDFASEVELQ